jgi:CTP-dependent riboflavin kinase
MLKTRSSFEVSRAAPESAGIRRAWVEPEAHGDINVKACPINPVSAAVEIPERTKHKTYI